MPNPGGAASESREEYTNSAAATDGRARRDTPVQQHRTKHRAVFEHLRAQIMSGALPPGARLTIRELAAQLGVSEIPVREALKQLEMEGLIRTTPYTGVQVSRLGRAEMREIAEIREALEPHAARLAAGRMEAADLRRLADCIEEMERAVADGDAEEYGRLNRAFHEIIYAACGNRRLYEMIFSLWDNVTRNQAVFSRIEGHRERSLQEHRIIYEALKLGNPELAFQAMTVHRRNAATSVRKLAETFDRLGEAESADG